MKNWIQIGIKALPLIMAAVNSIENFLRGVSGQSKEDSAYNMFRDLLAMTEGVTGKDLADDQKVEEATRNVFKAVVSFQNVIRDIKAKQATA